MTKMRLSWYNPNSQFQSGLRDKEAAESRLSAEGYGQSGSCLMGRNVFRHTSVTDEIVKPYWKICFYIQSKRESQTVGRGFAQSVAEVWFMIVVISILLSEIYSPSVRF